MLQRTESILFVPTPTSNEPSSFLSRIFKSEKLNPHVGPAIVGAGLVLAGFAVPHGMLKQVGQWVVEEGRKEWIDEEEAMVLAEEEETWIEKKIDNTALNGDDRKSELSDKSITFTDGNLLDNESHQAIHSNIVVRTQSAPPSQHKSNSLFDMIGSSIMQTALAPSLEDLHRGKAFSFSRFVEKNIDITYRFEWSDQSKIIWFGKYRMVVLIKFN